MCVDSPEAANNYTYASKIITIGGEQGSVAWVDLWNGILICDLLSDSQILHYIPLPSLVVPMLHKGGPPLHVRDINLIGGYIRYVLRDAHLLWTAPGDYRMGGGYIEKEGFTFLRRHCRVGGGQ